MSVLVLGLSHHSAPMALLERVSLDPDSAERLAHRVAAAEAVEGAVVLSTCNRLELYAGALTFHGALASMGEALAAESGVALEQLREHLYVHYEDRAVAHACSVAAGLDSMAVGESQILGQLREAYRAGQRAGLVPEELGSVLRHALHVGKRAHAETGIDRVSHSLVQSGLASAAAWVGPDRPSRGPRPRGRRHERRGGGDRRRLRPRGVWSSSTARARGRSGWPRPPAASPAR